MELRDKVQQGKAGGYQLARKPEEITLAENLQVVT